MKKDDIRTVDEHPDDKCFSLDDYLYVRGPRNEFRAGDYVNAQRVIALEFGPWIQARGKCGFIVERKPEVKRIRLLVAVESYGEGRWGKPVRWRDPKPFSTWDLEVIEPRELLMTVKEYAASVALVVADRKRHQDAVDAVEARRAELRHKLLDPLKVDVGNVLIGNAYRKGKYENTLEIVGDSSVHAFLRENHPDSEAAVAAWDELFVLKNPDC